MSFNTDDCLSEGVTLHNSIDSFSYDATVNKVVNIGEQDGNVSAIVEHVESESIHSSETDVVYWEILDVTKRIQVVSDHCRSAQDNQELGLSSTQTCRDGVLESVDQRQTELGQV